MLLGEVILPRRAKEQPARRVATGGDCGACVLAGILQIPIEEVYAKLKEGEIEGFSWPAMRQAIISAKSLDLADRVICDVPSWQTYEGQQTWGSPSWLQSVEWFSYVRMALDAGYYGICSVSYKKKGPLADTDHVVLLCGAREISRPHEVVPDARTIHQEIMISCSASNFDGYWIGVEMFLTKCGGFNVMLMRPR